MISTTALLAYSLRDGGASSESSSLAALERGNSLYKLRRNRLTRKTKIFKREYFLDVPKMTVSYLSKKRTRNYLQKCECKSLIK